MDWAERIDTMANGYCNAAVLLTAYQVGLFDALAAGGRTPTEMAPELELDPRALDVVMHALAAAGILQQEGERFALVPETRPYLLADGAETMTSIMGHRLSLMRRWSLLEDVLRSGEPIPRAQPTERELRNFICGMENVSRRSSRTVAERIDLSGAARLLDLAESGLAVRGFRPARSGENRRRADRGGRLAGPCDRPRGRFSQR